MKCANDTLHSTVTSPNLTTAMFVSAATLVSGSIFATKCHCCNTELLPLSAYLLLVCREVEWWRPDRQSERGSCWADRQSVTVVVFLLSHRLSLSPMAPCAPETR